MLPAVFFVLLPAVPEHGQQQQTTDGHDMLSLFASRVPRQCAPFNLLAAFVHIPGETGGDTCNQRRIWGPGSFRGCGTAPINTFNNGHKVCVRSRTCTSAKRTHGTPCPCTHTDTHRHTQNILRRLENQLIPKTPGLGRGSLIAQTKKPCRGGDGSGPRSGCASAGAA